MSDLPVEPILATKSVGRKQIANVFTFYIKQQHGRSYALKPAWQLAVLSVLSFIHPKSPSHPITFPAVTGQWKPQNLQCSEFLNVVCRHFLGSLRWGSLYRKTFLQRLPCRKWYSEPRSHRGKRCTSRISRPILYEQNEINADHTCIWSCSPWVGRNSARCLPDSTCKSYQQRSVYRAACCWFFGSGVGCEVPRSEVSVTARHRLACG
jgi:hypothetical protein